MMKPKKAPFRDWLNKQPSTDPMRRKRGLPMTVPEFVAESKKRGVITAKDNSLYNTARGSVPRNIEYYRRAWPGIQF